jgi:hypothetical protein
MVVDIYKPRGHVKVFASMTFWARSLEISLQHFVQFGSSFMATSIACFINRVFGIDEPSILINNHNLRTQKS